MLFDASSLGITAPTALPPTDIILSAFTIVANAAQGVAVGTAATNLGDVSVDWAINNVKFQLSLSSGATVEVQRSGTGTIVEGVAESITLTATRPGIPPAYPETFSINIAAATTPPTDFVTSFSLNNWSGSSSVGFARIGMPFADNSIPVGSIVEIRNVSDVVQDAQFDQRSYWPSGCLRFCVASIRATSWSGSEARVFNVYATPGTYDNTGTKTVADISATENFNVAISSFTQYNGTTTVTRASGAALASFNVDCLTTTRITKIASGDVREAWMIWGVFYDGVTGTGSADAHLKPIWYVDIWKNADDTIADFEYACVVSQDWWSIASKFRLNYTAVLKNGASTIYTYSTIQHPYRSQWITVRTDSDNGASKRPWKTAMPTLFYKPDKDYWVSTGLIPPLDTSFAPNSNSTVGYTAVYTPCSNMNHRAAIDGTGAYPGRGILPNMDCITFLRQTAEDTRYSRNNCLAGLSVPYHYRSNNQRTRPTESADVANTVIPLNLDPLPAGDYNFTAEGMPAATNSYARSGSQDGYVVPLGGKGVWSTQTEDASHAVQYSYFMYLLEGERYLMEASLDLATNVPQQTHGNSLEGRAQLTYYADLVYRAAFSIPSTQYGACVRQRDNPRALGWAHGLFGSAAAIVPDDDCQCGYMRLLAVQNGIYAATTIQYMPQSQIDLGVYAVDATRFHTSTYMNEIIGIGAAHHYNCTKDTNVLALAGFIARYSAGNWEDFIYRSIQIDMIGTPQSASWASGTNEFFARDDFRIPVGATADAGADTILILSSPLHALPLTNGDEIYFLVQMPATGGKNTGPYSAPGGTAFGTPYYLRDVSGFTAKIAASPGGVAIDLTGVVTNVAISIRQQSWNNYATTVNPPYMSNPDDYSPISMAALASANRIGVVVASDALVDAAAAFLAPVDSASWATWKYVRL